MWFWGGELEWELVGGGVKRWTSHREVDELQHPYLASSQKMILAADATVVLSIFRTRP